MVLLLLQILFTEKKAHKGLLKYVRSDHITFVFNHWLHWCCFLLFLLWCFATVLIKFIIRITLYTSLCHCHDRYTLYCQQARAEGEGGGHLPLFPLMPKVPFCQGNFFYLFFVIKRPFVKACPI